MTGVFREEGMRAQTRAGKATWRHSIGKREFTVYGQNRGQRVEIKEIAEVTGSPAELAKQDLC